MREVKNNLNSWLHEECSPTHTSGSIISKGICILFFFIHSPQTLTFLLLFPRGGVQEQKRLNRILPGSGERAGVAGGCWGLLQRRGRRALARPPARSGLSWSPGEGWFCYLPWSVFAKILSYWTDLTTFCCIYFYSVILPASVSAPACVTASEWMSGKQQTDARIKHMRKKEKLQAGLRERRIQKGIRNG